LGAWTCPSTTVSGVSSGGGLRSVTSDPLPSAKTPAE
jgi:hypothetical protein